MVPTGGVQVNVAVLGLVPVVVRVAFPPGKLLRLVEPIETICQASASAPVIWNDKADPGHTVNNLVVVL